MQDWFRKFGSGDLEKYMFLGVPDDWKEDVIDHLTSKVREYMDQYLHDTPPQFSSHARDFHQLMAKVFQFAEGEIWQHAFSRMGSDEPDRIAVTRSLAHWFDNSGTENCVVSEFIFDRLECGGGHGQRHTPTAGQIAKIVAALRKSLAAHFVKDGLPDVPALHAAVRELTQ